MEEIAIRNISKTFNPGLFKKKVRAVTDLSLEVNKGEVLGLIGPNGAGKSTTIRLVLGLIRPDSGEVLFRGKPLRETEQKREIGYLPESPYLYDHLTLDELLRFCGRVSGVNSKMVAKRSEELMAKLGLIDARRRPLRTFSKGMLQRAGICFALLHDPSVIILDEPMSGLDPVGRKMVFDLVRELGEEGKTVFFCSHILSDVERLCDRIALMVRGRLGRIFASDEIYREGNASAHLSVAPLDEAQQRAIESLPVQLAEERGAHVVSLNPENLVSVVGELNRMGAEIIGTRSEHISLEEIFMEAVEEGQVR